MKGIYHLHPHLTSKCAILLVLAILFLVLVTQYTLGRFFSSCSCMTPTMLLEAIRITIAVYSRAITLLIAVR